MRRTAEAGLFDEAFDAGANRFLCAWSLRHAVALVADRIFAGPPAHLEATARARRFAQTMDHILCRAFEVVARYTGGESDPFLAPVTLLATGDLGRRELCPHSGLELVVLKRHEGAAACQAPAERAAATALALPRFLDEAGLRLTVNVVGVDRLQETLHRLPPAATAELIEARFLVGDEELLRDYRRELARYLAEHGRGHLAARVRAERARRPFARGYRAEREPDLVDSPGGLRDIRALFAIDRVARAVLDHEDSPLVPWEERGSLDRFAEMAEHRDWLLARRAAEHLAAGTCRDRSLWSAPQLGAEHQRRARRVQERLERHLYEVEWRLGAPREDRPASPEEAQASLPAGFIQRDGRLHPGRDDLFQSEPLGRLLAAACAAVQQGLDYSEQLVLLARRDLPGATATVSGGEAGRMAVALRGLMRLAGGTGRALWFLRRAGALAGLIPGFERLTGQFAADPARAKALDEEAIARVEAVDAWQRRQGDPELARELARCTAPDLLKLALLTCDIVGDHGAAEPGACEAIMCTFGLLAGERSAVVRAWRERARLRDVLERGGAPAAPQAADAPAEELARLLHLFAVADLLGSQPDDRVWSRYEVEQLRGLGERLRGGRRAREPAAGPAASGSDQANDERRRARAPIRAADTPRDRDRPPGRQEWKH